MTPTTPVRTWDEASLPPAQASARRFEAAWRASRARPDPRAFLPDDPSRHPGAWLALLRADLGLRREHGESVPVEWYRDEYPEMSDEALVALIYEEVCLREEAGESPTAAEYLGRFPEVAGRLRRVLDIHDLVGSSNSLPAHAASASAGVAFPEAGQTIAGFRLVEELGRGSFARVFLAEERQLADRPVALKVARTGSREPQTLARLQHTHIVPVHSYRTDPATGLHLLCMPYLGRVTLAQVLADPAVARSPSGAELVAALDRLGPAGDVPWSRATGRQALIERDYVGAIAWWGARLAEALAFAHERGVMHRDVKPTNVLVTADGMPMLLDFNLAWEARLDDPELALGGTLAYMAPEHLRALAGVADKAEAADGRADVYSLGVVLFEAMGARPFPPPTAGARSVGEALAREAEVRRAGAPGLRRRFPEVGPAFEAVVAKCLAPDPADRYASAADLAADLQAVADDRPLRHARESLPARACRQLRRHRVGLGLAASAVAALAIVTSGAVEDRMEEIRRVGEARGLIALAEDAIREGDLKLAGSRFDTAAQIAAPRNDPAPRGWRGHLRRVLTTPWDRVGPDPALVEVRRKAEARSGAVAEARRAREEADRLHRDADRLRAGLLRPDADPERTAAELCEALAPFAVLAGPGWAAGPKPARLDESRRARLLDDVDDVLFFWVVAADRRGDPRALGEAVQLCDRALTSARSPGPWRALRARCAARWMGHEPAPGPTAGPFAEREARVCFQWALLRRLEGRPDRAVAWLERAAALSPLEFSYRAMLAEQLLKLGRAVPALEHAGVAVALRGDDPGARRLRERALESIATVEAR